MSLWKLGIKLSWTSRYGHFNLTFSFYFIITHFKAMYTELYKGVYFVILFFSGNKPPLRTYQCVL